MIINRFFTSLLLLFIRLVVEVFPIGSMVLLYMVTWIPSMYPSHVSIYTSTMDPMGFRMNTGDIKTMIMGRTRRHLAGV